jgi:MoxR-like ATPase
MSDDLPFQLYTGIGQTLASRNITPPMFEKSVSMDDPAGYIADEGLRDAVNVALALGQPLLLTGDPGTGKTQLATSLADEMGLPGPLVFNTKTTSSARDLFYSYDSLSHFQAVLFKNGDPKAEKYITYQALGMAILLSHPPDKVKELLPGPLQVASDVRSGLKLPDEVNELSPELLQSLGQKRWVVLIDEIDKAPRDLPNDVLMEIETMTFTVRETGKTFSSEQKYRPIIILTSNSEKNLPDAFLRRCVFYHIPFPKSGRLKEIVERRLGKTSGFTPTKLNEAIEHFEKIRNMDLKKKPATAEFLSWVQIVSRTSIDFSDLKSLKPDQAKELAFSYSVLTKTREDLQKLLQTFTRSVAE